MFNVTQNLLFYVVALYFTPDITVPSTLCYYVPLIQINVCIALTKCFTLFVRLLFMG